uniref:Putative secreted peptide n=1 Tax=Anopheles braziliensis TaxID=58242 RepID=A0A2M3ZPC2_9DIPT
MFSSNSSKSAEASALANLAAWTSWSSSAAASADSNTLMADLLPSTIAGTSEVALVEEDADGTTVRFAFSRSLRSRSRSSTSASRVDASSSALSTVNRSCTVVELLKYAVVKLPPSIARSPSMRFWFAFLRMFSSIVFSLTRR